jgi:hypothetical protein
LVAGRPVASGNERSFNPLGQLLLGRSAVVGREPILVRVVSHDVEILRRHSELCPAFGDLLFACRQEQESKQRSHAIFHLSILQHSRLAIVRHLLRYREALRIASQGLHDNEPIVSHRLRHTYATTLLAGGMSLVGVMRLLGHKDYRMTLRYAAITDETVLAEYTAALDRNKTRYQLPVTLPPSLDVDPATQLSELARHLLMRAQDDRLDAAKTRNLARRLRRLSSEVRRLQKRSH